MTLIDTAGKMLPPRYAARLTPVFEVLTATDETGAASRMAMIAFAIRVVSAAIAFVSQIILARLMGEFEYGVFVFVWVIAIILGNLSCLGFHTAVIRFLPQYRTAGADEAIMGLAATARIFSMLSATLIAATGIAALYFLGDRIESHYVQPLFVGAFVLPMIALGDVLDGTARANGWPVYALSPTYIVRPLLILAFVAGAIGLGRMADANTAILAALAAAYLTTVIQFVVVTGKLRNRFPARRVEIHFRTWLLVAFPIFLIEGFYFMLTNADVIIVGLYLPPEKVAVYFAAAKTMALVHFVYFAVKAAAAQRFSGLVSGDDPIALAAFARQTVQWTFWPSLLVGGLVIMAGPFLLSLFGPAFQDGHMIMVVLFAGIIAKAMIGPGEVLLTMAGEHKICAAIYATALAANLALNVILIPAWGLIGAATATAAAMVIEACLLHVIVRQRLGIVMFIASRPPAGARHSASEAS
ncbi:MAG: lipopolysaccharide biosynthesis protein [Hoeflea sp.]|uniref:lipopolysaccharide biosynthesis protein n=1 Tax=Hoeflea sp. TaxID=1940281 RepID=UPI001D54F768|nr:lipopolysaccharide biosynthesis protein [Hoeflea sp.]MBU4528679.1 lipopolysaccharide biosynthesis protein [Alphaproteobacteria bacterium]MBU4545516.1 lipopolysaccharide biosynthesis protein [Alphaproteobacteria bacterium]MBU4552126.1 lipopolysaccharide biosynthesis protein [Alphaproteobacteria bacterium]MBV1726282.1 lipopolysaccharide biosynthesis protein [Hoeflea sp.]MBV1762291.1 lipopolysaccharide biosynthesis protein [Hoeflea sp.]